MSAYNITTATAPIDIASGIYLIRFVQHHESFRLAEIEALSRYLSVNVEVVDYQAEYPFCLIRFVRLPSRYSSLISQHTLAREFISRSILAKSISEFWAQGIDHTSLHQQIKSTTREKWPLYHSVSFKFSIDSFNHHLTLAEQRSVIENFSYLGLEGRIVMKNPEEEFIVFEEWEGLLPEQQSLLNDGSRAIENTDVVDSGRLERLKARKPRRVMLGRFIGSSRRHLAEKHDLKKRPYISTTSMDAELALITAVLALATPGKLFLDPFTGTGGFMVAAAELGAIVFGGDIDGRSFRGKGVGLGKGVGANFTKYGLESKFGDCLTTDLTNTCWRKDRWLDGIISDPPYGVREGLKVLGRRFDDPDNKRIDPNGEEKVTRRAKNAGPFFAEGVESHTLPGFIAPKRPYSFDLMLGDILDFAVRTLVDRGRLAFWMPCANEVGDEVFPIPRHVLLELKHCCVQVFNKWSRRLLVYERKPGEVVEDTTNSRAIDALSLNGSNHGRKADDLNQFRRLYFRGFAPDSRDRTSAADTS